MTSVSAPPSPVAATTFPRRPSRGGDAAVWVAIGLLFLALAALVLGGSRDPGGPMVALCVVATLLASMGTLLLIWSIAYQRLVYVLSDSALRIDWLGRTVVVPYAAVQGIYSGQRLSGNAAPSVPCWPGISVGPRWVRGMGRLRYFATSNYQAALTFITVDHGGVIISPRDPQEFQAALIERVEALVDSETDVATWRQVAPTSAPWTALADGWLPVCAALGLILLLVILALIAFQFDGLPDQVAMHFEASGAANEISPKSYLLRLPLFGLACLVLDWVLGTWLHPRERLMARVLWVGGVVVQIVLLIGVVRIVT